MMYRFYNPPSFFSINPLSGIVTANGTIDREMNTAFVITVIASETQGLVCHYTNSVMIIPSNRFDGQCHTYNIH